MIDFSYLDNDFARRFITLKELAAKESIELQAFRGFVDLFEHAECWRQQVADIVIDQHINELMKQDCKFLAQVLIESRTSGGARVKHAPGFCWHNFGEAMDVRVFDLRPDSDRTRKEIEACIEELCEDVGIVFPAESCCRFDYVEGEIGCIHLQKTSDASPLDVMSYLEIEEAMIKRYKDGNHN